MFKTILTKSLQPLSYFPNQYLKWLISRSQLSLNSRCSNSISKSSLSRSVKMLALDTLNLHNLLMTSLQQIYSSKTAIKTVYPLRSSIKMRKRRGSWRHPAWMRRMKIMTGYQSSSIIQRQFLLLRMLICLTNQTKLFAQKTSLDRSLMMQILLTNKLKC